MCANKPESEICVFIVVVFVGVSTANLPQIYPCCQSRSGEKRKIDAIYTISENKWDEINVYCVSNVVEIAPAAIYTNIFVRTFDFWIGTWTFHNKQSTAIVTPLVCRRSENKNACRNIWLNRRGSYQTPIPSSPPSFSYLFLSIWCFSIVFLVLLLYFHLIGW